MNPELPRHSLRKVIPESEILSRIDEMGDAAAVRYAGLNPIFLRVLDGAHEFATHFEDRARSRGLVFESATIRVKSMEGMETTGTHRIDQEYAGPDLTGRTVVLLEDIIDTGETIDFLLEHLAQFAPSIIRTIALFAKNERRVKDVEAADVGFDVKGFVVGFNLDWDNHYRELRDLWVVRFPPKSFKAWLQNLIPPKAKRRQSPA